MKIARYHNLSVVLFRGRFEPNSKHYLYGTSGESTSHGHRALPSSTPSDVLVPYGRIENFSFNKDHRGSKRLQIFFITQTTHISQMKDPRRIPKLNATTASIEESSWVRAVLSGSKGRWELTFALSNKGFIDFIWVFAIKRDMHGEI